MSTGYIKYWNLKEKPFEESCNARYFFESSDHREALDRLRYIISDRNMNMALLTGEIGSGKTITRNVFTSSLSHHEFTVLVYDNTNIPFIDILFDMVYHLTAVPGANPPRMPARTDKYMLMNVFRNRVEQLWYREKKHLVVVFDEAQQMAPETLDELRTITNCSADHENFITIYLIGQPELRETIRSIKQVDQRIFLRFHLNNLDYKNTVDYIQHRIRIAGVGPGTIFDGAALEAIFRFTQGVPREINRLCKLSLHYGFAREIKELSGSDIAVVIDDLKAQQ